jgi:magnesium and cobalt transporter
MSDNPSEDHKQATKPRSWLESLTHMLGREPKNRDELMEVLRASQTHDILSTEMLAMIERILQVSEMQVREVMVPKAQMVVFKKDCSLENLLPMVIESGHSRFPVIDNDDKEIVGMLLAKDLLPYCFDKEKTDFLISDILRPAIFTSQSKRLDILLREFRSNRNHIAIVLDEYGHVAGLVTIEDVLEQIVGEIEDEYDIDEDDEDLIKQIDTNTYIVKATATIEEFNGYFKTHISNEEFDTIGGIILSKFGRFPKRGERVKFQGYRFKVLQSDSRRIYLLEVKPAKR